MRSIDVTIIGAGPYGMSLAACLAARGVEHRIFGEPMESWRKAMPEGMSLKSDGWSSNLYNPGKRFVLADFCKSQNIPYHDSQSPVPLDTFLRYTAAFEKRFVPNVEKRRLTSLTRPGDDFELHFDDGVSVKTKNVVLSVGIHPFSYVPMKLSALPQERVSHSNQYGPLDGLKGKHVTIVGAGASATDLAVLLHEKGADVLLTARTDVPAFGSRSSLKRSRWQRLRHPDTGIGGGWIGKTSADMPRLYHALPLRYRLYVAKTELGPSGGWFMAQRFFGHVPTEFGRTIESVTMANDKIELSLRSAGGDRRVVATDHVIAATGYRIDMRRLPFLDASILRAMRQVENAPVLSRDYETSVPGLYVIGPATMNSFGPVARFVFGAENPSRRLSQRFAPSVPQAALEQPLAA